MKNEKIVLLLLRRKSEDLYNSEETKIMSDTIRKRRVKFFGYLIRIENSSLRE